eukprot:497389-Prymnesium_polylepis.1
MAQQQLARASSHAQLEAYLKKEHELLAALLPEDTTCDDLFSEVDSTNGSLAEFFDKSDDPAVGRELKRLGHRVAAWLIEEKANTKAMQKRDKRQAERKARQERLAKKPRVFGEPPKPAVMAFEAAQLVAGEAQKKRAESAREALLEKGWLGKFKVPSQGAPPHQQWFKEDPTAACTALGAEYRGMHFGEYHVYFPRAALVEYEKIKRETPKKESGKGALKIVTPMPYVNYSLPVEGRLLTWQEFFSFVGHAYNTTNAAVMMMIMKNEPEQIEEMGDALAKEKGIKYDIKIERASKEIAKVDQRMAEAREVGVKAELEKQLVVSRAERDALIDARLREIEEIQMQYGAYKETKLIKIAQIKAKKEKAGRDLEALWKRQEPARGANSSDGAAALAAIVTGKSVADKAAAELVARAMSI